MRAIKISLKPVLLFLALAPSVYGAETSFPHDFHAPPVITGGVGGGITQSECRDLRRYPVIMIPDIGRDHRDWTGGDGDGPKPGPSVTEQFIRAGFRPVELWMIDFARAGEQMSSIEEATDDLKFFIAAVLGYTGAEKAQILAHGAGCLLARHTILKYHIAHWIDSEVYINGPFHGVTAPEPELSLRGYPNMWCLAPGSDLLREITVRGESPIFRNPTNGNLFKLKTLTLRNGTGHGNPMFAENPESPSLEGARNVMIPGLDHDGLRRSEAAAAVFIPFLIRKTRPMEPFEDQDRDGFKGVEFGGPDCRDNDPAIFPGAEEIAGDSIDQDCNGCDLAPQRGRDAEIPLDPGASSAASQSSALAGALLATAGLILALLCLAAAAIVRRRP